MYTFYAVVLLCLNGITPSPILRNYSKYKLQTVPTLPLNAAEIDMFLQRNPTSIDGIADQPLYDQRLAKHAKSGRSEVEAAIKAFQRFTLQLDRSDGRPDISLPQLAEKFDDFVSTCVRTDGAAWTAAIGPLDYLGLKLPAYRKREGTSYILDIPALCVDMGTKLLDLPPERSERTKMIEKSELHRNAVWALGLVTARLACRFVLLEDFLEGNAMQCSDPELILRYRNHPTDTADAILDISIPPPEMLEGILAVDLKVDYIINEESNSFVASRTSVAKWIEENKL